MTDDIPDTVINKDLYILSSLLVTMKNPKKSTYRPMQIMKVYRDNGGKIKTRPASMKVGRWKREGWVNLTPYALGLVDHVLDCPPCGKKHPEQGDVPSICRPTIKRDVDTPRLAQDYSKRQIIKALQMKTDRRPIDWNSL